MFATRPSGARIIVRVLVMIASTGDLLHYLTLVYVPSRLELSDGAIHQIAVACRQFSSFLGRPATVYDFDEDLLRRFLTAFRKGHAAATTNSRRRDLLALWQSAYDEGYLDRPPRRKRIPRARAPPPIPEAWTSEEVGRIFRAATEETGTIAGLPAADWWLSFFGCLYDTAERRGAALGLATEDVSIEDGRVLFRHTKTGRPRVSFLHADTLAVCRRIYDPQRPLMWPWPYSMKTLNKHTRRILQRAGVRHGQGKGGVLHKFRRTSGSLVEQHGGDGAKHLGNSRAVFERHYRDPRFLPNTLQFLPRPKLP